MALVYRSFLEEGHDWGDDFSLYINQARSLVRGDVPQVVADTRYMLQNSGSATFSPYVYPWGFPLLLAPVYLVAGIDYGAFAWVTVGSLVVFLWGFRRLIAQSVGSFGAWFITAVVALSVPYVRATGAVLSDLPAIAVTVVALLWFERCRVEGHFARSARGPLVVAGLLVTFAFSIRRETVVLLVALMVTHLVSLRESNQSIGEQRRRPRVVDVATPYWVFALSTALFHLMLPASLEQQATDGGGIGEITGNLRWYRDIFAEHTGLKDIGPNDIEWLGSTGAGRVVMATVLAFAVGGVVSAVVRRRGPELMIVIHVGALSWIVLTQPFRDGRYIFGLTPFVVYFAWVGASQMVAFGGRDPSAAASSRLSSLVPLLIVGPLLVANIGDFRHALNYHRNYDYVIQGPDSASSQEMFAAVERCTRGDDVVVFARARAMNLYTNRRAIQTGDVNLALQRADWMMLSNDDVDYYEPKVNEQNYREYGLARVWSNTEFSLYRIGTAPGDQRDPCPSIDQ